LRKTLAYRAAFYGFLASVLIAGFIFGMPWGMVTGAAAGGLVFGFIRMAGAATFLTGLISGPILGLSVTVAP